MNSINLQPGIVVTSWWSEICTFGLVWGPLGLFLVAFCCSFGSAFGGGYFGLFLLPFCLAFWGCVQLVLYSMLPGGMEWLSGCFLCFLLTPIPHTLGGDGEMVWRPFRGMVSVVLARFSLGVGGGVPGVVRCGCF